MKTKQEKRRGGRPRTPNILLVIGLLYEPADSNGEVLKLIRKKRQVSKVARACDCSIEAVDRISKAFDEGGLDQVGKLRWGAGAPKKTKMSMAEVKWLMHRDTLRRQTHLNMV